MGGPDEICSGPPCPCLYYRLLYPAQPALPCPACSVSGSARIPSAGVRRQGENQYRYKAGGWRCTRCSCNLQLRWEAIPTTICLGSFRTFSLQVSALPTCTCCTVRGGSVHYIALPPATCPRRRRSPDSTLLATLPTTQPCNPSPPSVYRLVCLFSMRCFRGTKRDVTFKIRPPASTQWEEPCAPLPILSGSSGRCFPGGCGGEKTTW